MVLKKLTCVPELLQTRPVFNFHFSSEIFEKPFACNLFYVVMNYSYEVFQAAFGMHHSTKTTFVKVTNDLLIASNVEFISALFLLQFSAACDIEHHIPNPITKIT